MTESNSNAGNFADAIAFDECSCDSPARDPVKYRLPDGVEVEIIACVECGGAVTWDVGGEDPDEELKDELGEAKDEISSLKTRIDVLEKTNSRMASDLNTGVNPWDILYYHPDFYEPDKIGIVDPTSLPNGEVYRRGEGETYHLPRGDGGSLCGKATASRTQWNRYQLNTEKKYENVIPVTSDELDTLRPCATCLKQLQRFREKRLRAIKLVQKARDEIGGVP